MFKLRSTIFLIMFPLTFTEAIISLWVKIIPSGLNRKEMSQVDREDIELIGQTRHAIREFVTNLLGHLGQLHEYLQ